MATRKLTTIRHLEEFGLKAQTLKALQEAGVKVEELITATRNDVTWRTYLPKHINGAEANHLTAIPGISKVRAQEIVEAVDEAGFILHENETSHNARRLFAEVEGDVHVFLERYETLENMEPEALAVVDEILRTLPEREWKVVSGWLCRSDDGYLSLEDFAHRELGCTEERAWQLVFKAESRLRGSGNYARLKVATCYTRETLSEEMAALRHEIDRLQQELDGLKEATPYAELRAGFTPLEELGLSRWAYTPLVRAGISSVEELVKFSDEDLLLIRNFDQQSLDEVRRALAKRSA